MNGRNASKLVGGRVGKSALCITPRSDGERNLSSEAADPKLSRKATSETDGARTANRHR